MSHNNGLRLFFIVLFALCSHASPDPVSAQGCRTKGEWADVGLLPANGTGDTNIKISLSADKVQFAPGEDIVLLFQCNRDCYLTLMDLGTSGRIVRLWPNDFSGSDNFVRAAVPRRFPGAEDRFKFRMEGPAGVERIVAYATAERGNILSENDFQRMANSGFTQFIGGPKDLAMTFKKNADALGAGGVWGTTQLNLCVGAGASAPDNPIQAAKVFVVAAGASTGDLKWCDRDAQRFVDTLKSRMGVLQTNIRLLTGTQATHEGFTKSLKWLETGTQPEDTAVVYFSGHGASIPDQGDKDEEDGKDECLVLYHSGRSPSDYQTALQRKIFLLDDEFNRLLKAIPARRKVIVVDTCHSGSIHKYPAMSNGGFIPKYMPFKDATTGEALSQVKSKLGRPPGYGNNGEALLAGCKDDQNSAENSGLQAGVFTDSLVKAIEGGATDLEQAFEAARRATEKFNKDQTPVITDPHGFVKLFRFGK